MARRRDPLREVEAAITPLARRHDEARRTFLGGYFSTRLVVRGLTVPEQRRLSRRGFSFSSRAAAAQFACWQDVWRRGRSMEALAQPLFWLERQSVDDLAAWWPRLQRWVGRIDNWAHSDQLSNIYARILEHDPTAYAVFRRWNRSPNAWARRQSVVALLYFARQRRRPLPANKILPLVERLLGDQDPFVQKGVGWCLREAGTLYPGAVRAFITAQLGRLLAAAFATASEKTPTALRQRWKRRRTALRRSAKR